MKFLIYLLGFIITTPVMQAQDSWKVTLNNKTMLSSSKSDETLNTKKVKSTDWKKNGFLEISYTETTPSSWLHSMQFTDEVGNQLLTKDSVYVKIPTASIRKLMAGKKQLKIYLAISPSNPRIMAPSRLLHLCTLKLQ
jgi:ligand-binding SRPBCC domain-containing protein